MRPPDQARWNALPGDDASNGKAERTVVDRWRPARWGPGLTLSRRWSMQNSRNQRVVRRGEDA